MKKIFLLLLAIFALSCCNNDDDKPVAEIDKLPPATQTGANKAGCLVNGQAFVTKGHFPGGSGLYCVYQDGQYFTLSIGEKINGVIRSVGVFSGSAPLHINLGTVHHLGERGNDESNYGRYTSNGMPPPPSPYYYSTNSTVVGELIITYHNYEQAIISGTFWFDAVNSEGEIVEIREGRFDMKY